MFLLSLLVLSVSACSSWTSGSYSLEYCPDAGGAGPITFTLSSTFSSGHGWIAIGFGGSSMGTVHDGVVCVFDSNSNRTGVWDVKILNQVSPTEDAIQDLTSTSTTVSGSTGTCSFTRALNTGDSNDYVIPQTGKTSLIWAQYTTGAPWATTGFNLKEHTMKGSTSLELNCQGCQSSNDGQMFRLF